MSADAELLLVRLRSELAPVVDGAAGSAVERQVARSYGALAGEVRADAPIPGLARAAGAGLIEIAASSGRAAGDVPSTVAALLGLVGAAARSTRDDVPPTAAPVQPAAVEAASEPVDEAGPADTGTVGIGVPILPDD